MKLKKGIFLLLAIIIAFSSFYFVFARENEVIFDSENNVFCINSGYEYSTTGFQHTYSLNPENGKYVDFYIENVGEATFLASINGKSKCIFEPGDKGHIYMKVENSLLGKNKEYTFKAIPVEKSHGQEVGIYFTIGQKENPSAFE